MRLAAFCLITLATIGAATAAPRHAATPAAPARQTAGEPPHAWLFGAWTGGLFPVLDGMAQQDCRTQPTVVFSQDAVSHSALLTAGMTQRAIATVRATPTGAEFRFSPESTATPGFLCENADELHVARETINEISFPNCKAFPYKLQRCSQ